MADLLSVEHSDVAAGNVSAPCLYSRTRHENLRVWFAPEEMRGGRKIIEQIDRAIQVNDRLLLVLSEQSMESNWVREEIKRTRAVERRENRQKPFPIRLASLETLKAWQCRDTETGEDLASEVPEYFIPDFSNWKDVPAFEAAFAELLRDLRAQAG